MLRQPSAMDATYKRFFSSLISFRDRKRLLRYESTKQRHTGRGLATEDVDLGGKNRIHKRQGFDSQVRAQPIADPERIFLIPIAGISSAKKTIATLAFGWGRPLLFGAPLGQNKIGGARSATRNDDFAGGCNKS